jgi:hypothetical protein
LLFIQENNDTQNPTSAEVKRRFIFRDTPVADRASFLCGISGEKLLGGCHSNFCARKNNFAESQAANSGKLLSVYCTFTALSRKSLIVNGAGEGNRTLVNIPTAVANHWRFTPYEYRSLHTPKAGGILW